MQKKSIGAKLAVYPVPLYLVATYDREGKPNVMTVGWGGVCNGNPPCLSISVRPATHTYHALMERRAFTVNLPAEEHAAAVAYCGRVSGKDENKFEKAGFTPVKAQTVDAPFILETPVSLECKIIQIHDIGSHTQFIGEIVNTHIDSSLQESIPLVEQTHPIVYAVGDNERYYPLGAPLHYKKVKLRKSV